MWRIAAYGSSNDGRDFLLANKNCSKLSENSSLVVSEKAGD